MCQYLEGERVGVFSQLFNQALLQTSQTLVLFRRRRERLDVHHKEVFPERQAKDVQILSTVTERTGQGHKHCWEETGIRLCLNRAKTDRKELLKASPRGTSRASCRTSHPRAPHFCVSC